MPSLEPRRCNVTVSSHSAEGLDARMTSVLFRLIKSTLEYTNDSSSDSRTERMARYALKHRAYLEARTFPIVVQFC
jgi:hypothetical protein